jgi:hypothetical protein
MPIFLIKPSHMTTTNDTVAYVFDGRGMGKDQYQLLSQKSLKKAGTLSITYTFNGDGASAPVFVSVNGLTKHELPKEAVPSGLLALKIQGLCVGGSGINLGEMLAGGWLVILFNHVKEDLKSLDATDSLLAPISNFLLATNAEAQLEGAYLYEDKNRGKWVRSGKVIGRTYAVRCVYLGCGLCQ